jgi:energy-coupling factor transporter ATP-binding protein EcfA2
MTFAFEVPRQNGPQRFEIEPGASIIFVGANGSGKTRLAVQIESALGQAAHRIAAHRSLKLNPDVPKINQDAALRGLRNGHADPQFHIKQRAQNRWKNNAAVHLLNDFDFVVQALFAEQANTSLRTHKSARSRTLGDAPATKFEALATIWETLLPQRRLDITGDDIQVFATGQPPYSASDMSDGERAIFYMLGQALMASADSVLVVDEPELHVHPSILGSLWDEVQAARPDCAFVFITHDLNFAANRVAQKIAIRDYRQGPLWTLDEVPEEAGFDETLVTAILGSRRPVLFVEGTEHSLDAALYRSCFPGWLVIPRGSCEHVVHAVVTMRKNASLTRITCAGVVDSDDYEQDEIVAMNDLGIGVLPVSEIENLFLLPTVSRTIAVVEGFEGTALETKLQALEDELVAAASKAIDSMVMQCCRRRIDRILKKIDLSGAATPFDLDAEYRSRTQSLDVNSLAQSVRSRMEAAINARDIPAMLRFFDGKGAFLNAAAKHLRATRKDAFEEWLTRVIRTQKPPDLVAAIQGALPAVVAR